MGFFPASYMPCYAYTKMILKFTAAHWNVCINIKIMFEIPFCVWTSMVINHPLLANSAE